MPSSMKKTYPHFIDVILDSTIEAKKMKIPQNFVGRFGDELSNVATLTNPEGYVMRVGITRKDGKIWFDDGWNEFVEDHSIDVGYFVLFQYRKNSKFRVFIYNTTTCEIQYPSRNTFPPPRQNQATFDSSQSKNGCEMRGKTYRMEEVKAKEESDNENDLMQDVIGTCSSEGSVHAKIHLSETQCSSVQETDLKIDSTKFKKAKHNLKDELRADSVDQVKLFALLEDMDIHICESRMTLEERQEAINVARLLKPEKPSFLVLLRARNMKLNYLYVPTSFARKYLNGEESVTVHDSDGTKLAVKVKQSRRKYLLTGWGKFFKKANVKEGDILFFEMIQDESEQALSLRGNRNELIALLQDMGIDICKSWKSLSVEERQGAINAARIFNLKNPSFLVILQYVLATFGQKCLSGDECIIEQDSDESKLAVAFKLNCSKYFLTGLAEFFKASNMKEKLFSTAAEACLALEFVFSLE